MKFWIHDKEIEYFGEECGFYKFNGIIWDYIDFDTKMFMEGLNDIGDFEAIDKVEKMLEVVCAQAEWIETPKPTIKSSFIEVKMPIPIDLVRPKIQNSKILLERILNLLKS